MHNMHDRYINHLTYKTATIILDHSNGIFSGINTRENGIPYTHGTYK